MDVLSTSLKPLTVKKPTMLTDRKIVTPAEARKLQAAESLKPLPHSDIGPGSFVVQMQRAAGKNVKVGLVDAFVRAGREGKGCEKKECEKKDGAAVGGGKIRAGGEKEKEKLDGIEEKEKKKNNEPTKPSTTATGTICPLSASKPTSNPPPTRVPSNRFSRLDESASPKATHRTSRSSITPTTLGESSKPCSPIVFDGKGVLSNGIGKISCRAASAEEKRGLGMSKIGGRAVSAEEKGVLGDGEKRVISGGALGKSDGKKRVVSGGNVGGGLENGVNGKGQMDGKADEKVDGKGDGKGDGKADANEKRRSDKFDLLKKVADLNGGKK